MNALLGSIRATHPDFLWSFVGSLQFMRLSLKERRTRRPVQCCVQEIGAIDGCPMRLPRVKHLFFLRYPPHPSRSLRRGGIRKSHPSTSHNSRQNRREKLRLFVELQVLFEERKDLIIDAAVLAPRLVSPDAVVLFRLVGYSKLVQLMSKGLVGVDVILIQVAASPVKLQSREPLIWEIR